MNQYTPVSSTQCDSFDPQTWVNLCNSNDDFEIVIDKETLRSMISGFQTFENQACIEYFKQHVGEKISYLDDAFKQRYQDQIKQLQMLSDQNNESETVEEKKKQAYEKIVNENDALREDINAKEARVQQLKQNYQQQKLQMDEYITQAKQHIQQLHDTNIQIRDATNSMVQHHNELVIQYDNAYVEYDRLKKEYVELGKQRDRLKK